MNSTFESSRSKPVLRAARVAAPFSLLVAVACGGPAPSDAGDVLVTHDANTDVSPMTEASVDGGTDVTTPIDPNPRLATDVRLTDLAVFQGTRVGLFTNGSPDSPRNAPIVADRSAVIRAYVAPGAGFAARELTARLVVSRPGVADVAIDDTRRIAGASNEADPSSVFAFSVASELVTESARITVSILDANGATVTAGSASDARLPRDGSAAMLGAQSDGGGLELVLVPLRYDTDGSGRLPDTSTTQLDRIRSLLTALYPLRTVNITVHTPVPWSNSLTFTGNVNFGAVNQMLVDLRTSDGATARQYYYALVAPASDFSTYCGGSCVTGQSYVVSDPSDADSRVGSGVGWGTEDSVWTLVHEVGHEHGRTHAPCDAGGADPDFPYTGGSIGVWGYDSRSAMFIAPTDADDFMGYCDPTWTSDYTWSAIFERVRAVNGVGARIQRGTDAPIAPRRYQFVRVLASGDARRERVVRLQPWRSAAIDVRFLDASGAVLASGAARRLEESDAVAGERLYLVDEPPVATRWIEIGGARARVR